MKNYDDMSTNINVMDMFKDKYKGKLPRKKKFFNPNQVMKSNG